MRKTKEPIAKAEKFPRKAIPVHAGKTDDETGRNCANVVTAPELAAMRVIRGVEFKTAIDDIIDVPALMDQLRDQAVAVNRGDLSQAEAMLMNQATALQSLFARLTERGMSCEHVAGFEVNMRMALRAQNQCRATLETLAAIKNPPVIYARQANIANGPQQVNNAVSTHTRENENLQNKQSGGENGLLPYTGTPALAGRVNPAMEALGAVNRAEVKGG